MEFNVKLNTTERNRSKDFYVKNQNIPSDVASIPISIAFVSTVISKWNFLQESFNLFTKINQIDEQNNFAYSDKTECTYIIMKFKLIYHCSVNSPLVVCYFVACLCFSLSVIYGFAAYVLMVWSIEIEQIKFEPISNGK